MAQIAIASTRIMVLYLLVTSIRGELCHCGPAFRKRQVSPPNDAASILSALAGTLIIWDRMFGTFAEEDEEVVYGLTHNINTFDIATTQTHHWVHMWNMMKQQDTFASKFAVIWKGPGW